MVVYHVHFIAESIPPGGMMKSSKQPWFFRPTWRLDGSHRARWKSWLSGCLSNSEGGDVVKEVAQLIHVSSCFYTWKACFGCSGYAKTYIFQDLNPKPNQQIGAFQAIHIPFISSACGTHPQVWPMIFSDVVLRHFYNWCKWWCFIYL